MLKNYVKIAFKVFLRRKFFTFISLFGISLTLVVLMMVSIVLDNVFNGVPPEVHADRSVMVFSMSMQGPNSGRNGPAGYAFLDRYVRTLPLAEQVSIHSTYLPVSAYYQGSKLSIFLKRTDGAYWDIMAFTFLEGGPFTAADDTNAAFVAVINETTRTRFFGDNPAVGQSIEVDGQRFRVVGVVEDVSVLSVSGFSDIWVPISTAKSDAYKYDLMGGFWATVLAKDAADLPLIKSEFANRLPRVELPDGFTTMSGGLETIFENLSRAFFSGSGQLESYPERLLGILLALAGLFMVLPAVNLININVSRMLERASEIGVRRSFGASARTLVGQFVVENVLLCLLGGVLGFVLSVLALYFVEISGVLPYAEVHLNARVFLYGFLFTLVFGLFSGVYPAWRMARLHPVEALRRGA